MAVSWTDQARKFKSPLRVVVVFLLRSRARSRARFKALRCQYEELKRESQQQQLEHQREVEGLRQQVEQLRALQRERLDQRTMRLPEDPPVGSHGYGAQTICLAVNLARVVGLRGAARAMEIFYEWLGIPQRTPNWTTIRNWITRLGVAELEQPVEKADDWILMADHSNQVGKEHALVILGVRASELPEPGTALKHEDLRVLQIEPGTQWKAADMERAYRQQAERTGVPRGVLVDGAPQLRDGAVELQKQRSDCVVLRDFKHYAANVFESLVGDSEQFKEFSKRVGQTRSIIQQTELAHLLPPPNKVKCRFMNLAATLKWAGMASWLLEHPEAESRRGLTVERLDEKLGWLRDFTDDLVVWQECQRIVSQSLTFLNEQYLHAGAAEKLRTAIGTTFSHPTSQKLADRLFQFVSDAEKLLKEGERLPLSTEILESRFGLYKQLERQHSKGGFTSLLPALAVLGKTITPNYVREAFARVSTKKVKQWVSENLGTTLNSRRRSVRAEYAKATKHVTIQPAAT